MHECSCQGVPRNALPRSAAAKGVPLLRECRCQGSAAAKGVPLPRSAAVKQSRSGSGVGPGPMGPRSVLGSTMLDRSHEHISMTLHQSPTVGRGASIRSEVFSGTTR